ncbi:MAG: DMT family transporter [Planctomycetes bacterium]|nr:DMT family transporter [Planctomycetota bacterium]
MSESPSEPRVDWASAARVACGALLIACAPLLVKNVVPDPLGPAACCFWRTSLGGLALAAFALVRGSSLRVSRPVAGLAVLAGVFFALDLVMWHEAIRIMTRAGAGLATVLANTQVVWVALVGAFVLREGGGWKLAVGVASAVLGVSFIAGLWTPAGLPGVPTVGLLLGLATGVWYASFLLTLRRAQRRAEAPSTVALMTWASLATAVVSGVVALVRDEPMRVEGASAWGSVLGLALVVQALAWWLLTRNLSRIPAALGALLLLLQPTFATLGGVAFYGERLTVYEVVGAALILLGIYLGAVARRPRRAARAPRSA